MMRRRVYRALWLANAVVATLAAAVACAAHHPGGFTTAAVVALLSLGAIIYLDDQEYWRTKPSPHTYELLRGNMMVQLGTDSTVALEQAREVMAARGWPMAQLYCRTTDHQRNLLGWVHPTPDGGLERIISSITHSEMEVDAWNR